MADEQTKLIEQKEGKGSDESLTELSLSSKLIEPKEGKGSDDSLTELALSSKLSPFYPLLSDYETTELERPRKLIERTGEKGSDDSSAESEPFCSLLSDFETTEPERPRKMSKLSDRELNFLRRRSLPWNEPFCSLLSDFETTEPERPRKLIKEKGGKGSDDSSAESEMSKLSDRELYFRRRRSLPLIESKSQWLLREQREKKGIDDAFAESESKSQWLLREQREEKGIDDAFAESESTELEGVLLHTRILTVCDTYNDTPVGPRREGEKSGHDTVLKGDAGPQLHVHRWMITDDETHLELRGNNLFLRDFLSIVAPLCPVVEHISINVCKLHLLEYTDMPMPMRSVITVCIESLNCYGKLQQTLLGISKWFPNAEGLNLKVVRPYFLTTQASSREVNSSSSLRELTLTYKDKLLRYDVTKDSLFMDIFTSCPNIVSLVLSGFGRCLSIKSCKSITSCKMPNLNNIHLKPFRTDDYCQFETLMHVLHVVHVTSPRLKFVEAEKVQLGGALLASVKWSHTSLGCELQLEGASAAVPMGDIMHLVSNELKGVTVLTFDRCKVDCPQSTSHPPQSTGEESSLRELKFLNVECPLSQTDIHKLSEMYRDVKITVEHERHASHGDFKQGTRPPFRLERETFPSSPLSPTSSIDERVRALARVQVQEEETDSQNTEEEVNEEKEGDYIAMESLPHETVPDKINVKPIKMECCKRIGVKGGKLQLDSVGIELEIPPGAIDSEVPQDISLSVLTDTPNLGNSREEMSICFGVQCLAPDDLVLRLPVTYTIPHCAVITRYSRVEAVLYTGEGEYSPYAVVKERIILTRSGIPSCTIRKDALHLKMNHFSWAKIKLRIKKFFFRGKKMCCRPFKEKNLALPETPAILHVHLYDDIKGNSKGVENKEQEHNFIPALPEQNVLIYASEGHLKMTCYVNETVIGKQVVSSVMCSKTLVN